jgi:hypothetical protein
MTNEVLRVLLGSWDLLEAIFTAPDGSIKMPWGSSPIGIALIAETDT